MSRQDLEEKGKCPYTSFREFDRKLITITSKNKIFDNYGITKLENPFIRYFFIDSEEGVCVRIIGNEDNLDFIGRINKKITITENKVIDINKINTEKINRENLLIKKLFISSFFSKKE